MYRILFLILIVLITGCAPKPVPSTPAHCLTSTQLNAYSYDYLSRVSVLLRADAKNIDDFDGFITAIKRNVNDYASMIESSAYLSNVVRFLPIPYAGEVSNVTKLVSRTLLDLNSAAVALERYKQSNELFLTNFDKLNRSTATSADLAKLAKYADTIVLGDARDLHSSLQKISATTAAIAAASQSISNALESTNGYYNQAKSFVGIHPEINDKVRVNTSKETLNTKIAQLNKKISSLENSADTHRQNIAKARTYAELAIQIDVPSL